MSSLRVNDDTAVIIVSHGGVAEAMVEAAERYVGKLDVDVVAVGAGEPTFDIEQRIESAAEHRGTDEILFLLDLEGSTPFNLCCRRCGGKSVVLSGMNLPMLFKLATADRAYGALALAEELRATGIKSIHVRAGAKTS
jgi:mannose/fructose-specific phosphotransferase system component IIA